MVLLLLVLVVGDLVNHLILQMLHCVGTFGIPSLLPLRLLSPWPSVPSQTTFPSLPLCHSLHVVLVVVGVLSQATAEGFLRTVQNDLILKVLDQEVLQIFLPAYSCWQTPPYQDGPLTCNIST